MVMMSDLPPDLIVDIFCRVPATSLERLRTTCKQWNALFKDQEFSEKHFRKAPKESRYVMLKEYRLCSINVDLNVVPPSIEFKGGVSLEDPHSNSEQVDIAEVFHCEGLLLCNTIDERLVVWNPCSGEFKWIPPAHDNTTKRSFALGYKNDKSCRSYRILRRWRQDKGVGFGSEIYEFSSNSWRLIEDMDHTSCLLQASSGVSLKGNTYWLAYDLDKRYDILICFDFTTERSKPLCLPQSHQNSFFRCLSVVRDEQLSVLSWKSKLEIWVTTNKNIDTEAELSWSKFFEVDLLSRGESVIAIMGFRTDEEKKVALRCIYRGTFRRNMTWIIEGEHPYCKTNPSCIEENQWPLCNLYVPSLFRIQQKL